MPSISVSPTKSIDTPIEAEDMSWILRDKIRNDVAVTLAILTLLLLVFVVYKSFRRQKIGIWLVTLIVLVVLQLALGFNPFGILLYM